MIRRELFPSGFFALSKHYPQYNEKKLAPKAYKGGENLVWEIFCPEKFRGGKIPPQSLKVMGKIAPPFSMVKGKA